MRYLFCEIIQVTQLILANIIAREQLESSNRGQSIRSNDKKPLILRQTKCQLDCDHLHGSGRRSYILDRFEDAIMSW